MDEKFLPTIISEDSKIRGPEARRKMNILACVRICEKYCPATYKKLTSMMALETGNSFKKIEEYMQILYNSEKIFIEQDGIVHLKDKQGDKKNENDT